MKSITNNLNLGLLELLSVLLPGAVCLSFLLQFNGISTRVHTFLPDLNSWSGGIGYFAISYFLGYVVYVISSPIDNLFDFLKNRALKNKVFKDCHFEFEGQKWWAPILFPHIESTYMLINLILVIKKKHMGDCSAQPINAYQWAYRRLMMEDNPTMFREVDRYQATAKFFRSMVVIWLIGIVLFFSTEYFPAFFILLILSLWVYLNRWQKALHVAYKNAIILDNTITD